MVYYAELSLATVDLRTRIKAVINTLRYEIVGLLKWMARLSSRDPRWCNPGKYALFYRKLALAKVSSIIRVRAARNALRFSLIAGIKGLIG